MGAWALIRKDEIPVIFKYPNGQHALASSGSLFFAAEGHAGQYNSRKNRLCRLDEALLHFGETPPIAASPDATRGGASRHETVTRLRRLYPQAIVLRIVG